MMMNPLFILNINVSIFISYSAQAATRHCRFPSGDPGNRDAMVLRTCWFSISFLLTDIKAAHQKACCFCTPAAIRTPASASGGQRSIH
jgi:hypothetical protein